MTLVRNNQESNMSFNLTALNQNVLANVKSMFAEDLDAGQIKSISTARMRFQIKTGADGIDIGQEMLIIIAGEDKADHFLYYKSSFDGNATAPDAIWYRGTKAPSCVPQSALQRDVNGRLGYQVKRRIAAFVFVNGKLLPEPIAFDISGQSLYKSSQPGTDALSYTQYRKQLASLHAIPLQVVTRCTFDPKASVSVVKFQGERAASEDEIKTVLAHQEETRKILEIQLKGDEAPYSFGNKEPEPAPQIGSAPQIEPQLKPYNVQQSGAQQSGAPQDGVQPAEQQQIKEPDTDLDALLGDI